MRHSRTYLAARIAATLLVFGLILSGILPALPAQSLSETQPAPEGCSPNALILLDPTAPGALDEVVRQIEALGGCAPHQFPPDALFAGLPLDRLDNLRRLPVVRAIHTRTAPITDAASLSLIGRAALVAWNANVAQPTSSPTSNPPGAKPLTGDRFYVPTPPAPERSGLGPGYNQVSEFMVGKIAIGLILPESSGAAEPSTENWSEARMAQVVSEIQQGMSWWATINPTAGLSFVYDIQLQVPTRYEPINHPYNFDGVWISESLSYLGHPGSYWVSQAYSYLNDIRDRYDTDWAEVIFVVDSLNDPDGTFTDGYFGYSYGFLIVMTYDNDGWGISNMDSVTAHETAHNFGAGDEYCSPGYACCWGGGQYGYLGVANSNCEAGCDHNGNSVCDGDDSDPGSNCHNCPQCVETTCLMRQGGTWAGLDIPSREQVGMRDLDGDGLLDPIDTQPLLAVTGYPPDLSAQSVLTYTGAAEDIPFPSPSVPDVTINHILTVEVQIDDDPTWYPGLAADGAFDETEEDFNLTTPPLSDGEHTLALRATNRVGAFSNVLTDTVMVDTLPPTGTLMISGGDLYALEHLVQLDLTAEDLGTGVRQMQIGTDPDLPGSEPLTYTTALTWTLSGAEGLNTLYARFLDGIGNASPVYSDTIVLDLTAPESAVNTVQRMSGDILHVEWQGADQVSGLVSYDVQYRDNNGEWVNWQMATTDLSADLQAAPGHTYAFRCRARDDAGWVEDWPEEPDARITIDWRIYLPLLIATEVKTEKSD